MLMSISSTLSADVMKVDAAVLIGNKKKSRPICGENKNFLALKGVPLFFHVLQALDHARTIGRIAVVGDPIRIRETIEAHVHRLEHPDRILVLEQGSTLYDNGLKAFEKLVEAEREAGCAGDSRCRQEDKAVLYLAGDTPLLTSEEVDEFVEKCDVHRADYFLGVSAEQRLRLFYPTKKDKGIKLAYFYVKENKFRINNLHLVKPLRVRNRHYIQKMYDYRHQKEFFDFVRLLITFFRINVRSKGILYYFVLHWNLFLERIGLDRLTVLFRWLVDVPRLEGVIGDVLGCPFKITVTDLVGGVLDVDTEKHYEAFTAMFDRWREYQDHLIHNHSSPLQEQ